MKENKIERFDEQKANEKELQAYYDFFSEILKEAHPDDPPRPYEKFKKQILNYSDSTKINRWVIWENGVIISYAIMYLQLEGENLDQTDVDIFVRKKWRRKGTGMILLRKLYEESINENCSIMNFSTLSTMPSGIAFLQKINARLGSTEHINQLKIEDIDMDLMNEWIKKVKERASNYELELWRDGFPDDKIASFVKLYNDFWNSVPLDDLEYKPENISSQKLKNGMDANVRKGWKSWLLVAIHKTTKEPVGFTHMIYTGFNKELINQDDTGVAQEYRNKGLGRWLKAVMIKLIIKELLEIKTVRSENAVSNKPMLNINFEMGFKPYYSESYWQIKVEKIKKYLDSLVS